MGAERPYLTPAEAAARLRICTKTLGRLRRDGLIRYVAVTKRKILYRPADCDAFADAQATVAVPPPTFHRAPSPRRRGGGNVLSFTDRRNARRGG